MDSDRWISGRPCKVCERQLITSIAGTPLMTKVKLTREQILQRNFVKQYISKTLSQRTEKDIAQVSRLCPIDESEHVVSTPCGHLFHRECIRKYCANYKLVRKRSLVECPICRKTLLLSTLITIDILPIDCGHDQREINARKIIHELEKEQELVRDSCKERRSDLSQELKNSMNQMNRIKTFKREVSENYKSFWTDPRHLDLLRERKMLLRMEANQRVAENSKKAELFIEKLCQDKSLPLEVVLSLEKIRKYPEGIETFRKLIKAFLPKYVDPKTGAFKTEEFVKHFISVLAKGLTSES